MSRQVLTSQASLALGSWVALLRAHAVTTRDLSAKLFTDHGLTINDYEALLRLSHAEGQQLRRVDLADELVLTASGVTRLLDGLERAGYVEKGSCESDARVTYAVLTPQGREKLTEAAGSHVAQVQGLFEEHLTNDELATLTGLLSRLPGVSDEDGEACSP